MNVATSREVRVLHWDDFHRHRADLLALVRKMPSVYNGPRCRFTTQLLSGWWSVSAALKFMRQAFHDYAPEPPGQTPARITSYSARMFPGSSMVAHRHSAWPMDAELVGVLFLTRGSDLRFPELGKRVTPQPGRVVIFHGIQLHEVARHDEPHERISISFNRHRRPETSRNYSAKFHHLNRRSSP